MRRLGAANRERRRQVADGFTAGAVRLLIRIRPAQADDAAAIAAIYGPHVTHGIASFETVAPEAAVIAARMAEAGGRFPWLVAADGDGVAGYAYAGAYAEREAYRWAVETTVYVADYAQRRGIARLLYGSLIETLIAQGYAQAIARISLPNPGSVSLHEGLGFTVAGKAATIGWKQGRWIDVGIWQRALATPADPPAEPLPLDAIGR